MIEEKPEWHSIALNAEHKTMLKRLGPLAHAKTLGELAMGFRDQFGPNPVNSLAFGDVCRSLGIKVPDTFSICPIEARAMHDTLKKRQKTALDQTVQQVGNF